MQLILWKFVRNTKLISCLNLQFSPGAFHLMAYNRKVAKIENDTAGLYERVTGPTQAYNNASVTKMSQRTHLVNIRHAHFSIPSTQVYIMCIFPYHLLKVCRAGIAQSVYQWATGWIAGVGFPAGATSFLYSIASRPAMGPTQPSIQWLPEDICPGVKRLGRETDYSPPSSASCHTFSWHGA
jgi:hypothetical protein